MPVYTRFTVFGRPIAYRLPVHLPATPRGPARQTGIYGGRQASKRHGKYSGTIYRRTDLKDSSYFLRVFLKDEGRYLRRRASVFG